MSQWVRVRALGAASGLRSNAPRRMKIRNEPIARRAGSKFRVQGSKFSEITKRTQLHIGTAFLPNEPIENHKDNKDTKAGWAGGAYFFQTKPIRAFMFHRKITKRTHCKFEGQKPNNRKGTKHNEIHRFCETNPNPVRCALCVSAACCFGNLPNEAKPASLSLFIHCKAATDWGGVDSCIFFQTNPIQGREPDQPR